MKVIKILLLTSLFVYAQDPWEPLLLKAKYADDIVADNVNPWIIQKVQTLSQTNLYQDAVNVKIREWGGGLLASASDAEINNGIGPLEGPVPGVVARAGNLCRPQFRGALHPVARAVDTQNLKSVTLYCALAYSGDKVGIENAVYLGVTGKLEADGKVSTQLLSVAGYKEATYQNLLKSRNEWIESIKGVYEGLAVIPMDDESADPRESLPKAADVTAQHFRIRDLERKVLPPALNTQEISDRLAVEGKELFLEVMTEWVGMKKAHLTVLQEEEGDPIVINKMKRDLRSLAMDIWGYQNGMRPDSIRADKFQTAWWWNEATEDQWRRGEKFDFWWDLLEPEVFEPYLVFSTSDVAPGLNTSENTMKSFVLEMNRKNWEATGGMIKDGGSLNRVVNGGRRITPIDGGQHFLGQFEKFEVFSKSSFQLDGVDYVWWLLQARTKYQPKVYGHLLDFEEVGCPIQIITRKEGDGSWSVSTEFLDSRVMACVSVINGMPRRWVLKPKENNSYWVNLGDGSWDIDSEKFKSKLEFFLNPSKR